jgi:hypothetical protein
VFKPGNKALKAAQFGYAPKRGAYMWQIGSELTMMTAYEAADDVAKEEAPEAAKEAASEAYFLVPAFVQTT